ncbi:Acylphosphatase [Quillaja saponaria]|uniref:acylphosphatase n=1 Tax=Quillaja saponaria TaxID=32244 RepID=A0AAD7Q0C4_QUISA|nr:Acylphosphatase [Quillaja saponaria]
MASTIAVPHRPLIRSHSIRFHTSRNPLCKWFKDKKKKNVNSASRFSHLYHPHSNPPYLPFSLCNCLLLPHLPLHSLRRPCSSPLRHSLLLMTTPRAYSDSTNPSSIESVRVVIKGRVQGVFYRNWTVENAKQLGLKGWVRNRRDGSVEALFYGDTSAVKEMGQRCRRGPPEAMVTGLEVFPSNDDPGTGFQRKPTV